MWQRVRRRTRTEQVNGYKGEKDSETEGGQWHQRQVGLVEGRWHSYLGRKTRNEQGILRIDESLGLCSMTT